MVNENIGLILTKNCSLVSLNFTDITPNVSDTLADYEDVQIILSYPE
jgi:hypothetical protein